MSFEDFLRWHNITLRTVNISCHIKGFAYYNGNEYLVIINSRCSSYQCQATLIHEMIHIFENHLTCLKGYEEKCEQETQYIIENIKSNYLSKYYKERY